MKPKWLLICISILLFLLIWYWIYYLTSWGYITRCMEGVTSMDASYSHTIDLPLTTTTSCQNFCGPNARCSISGTQCFSDIDCYGCQQKQPTYTRENKEIPGNNDAGKLSFSQTPQYSYLTTNSLVRNSTELRKWDEPPPYPEWGDIGYQPNMREAQKLFERRYKPITGELINLPEYETRRTLTGEFITDGPLPSNY